MKKQTFTLLLFLGCISCGTKSLSNKEKFDQVKEGMTIPMVLEICEMEDTIGKTYVSNIPRGPVGASEMDAEINIVDTLTINWVKLDSLYFFGFENDTLIMKQDNTEMYEILKKANIKL